MRTTSIPARAISCALLAGTAYCGLTAQPAAAQDASPTFRNLDSNGVDLVKGDFLTSFPEGSIGSGEAELALLRMVGAIGSYGSPGSSQWDHILLNVTPTGTYVDFGSRSDKFPGAESRGATLAAVPGGYRYQTPDGTAVDFTNPTDGEADISNFCNGRPDQTQCILLPTSVSSPDLKRVVLHYEFSTQCVPRMSDDEPLDCTYAPRLDTVSNSFGYSIRFGYGALAPGCDGAPATHARRSGAGFFNSEAGSLAQATVSYCYPSGSVTLVTDPGGRVWRVTNGQGGQAIRRPGAAADTTSATSSNGWVASVTREGVTTAYSRSVSGSTVTMIVTDALNQATTIVSDLATGRPASITDPLNHTTAFTYETSGLLKRTTLPEGNYVENSYDSRGNLTQVVAVPKGGGGATIVTSASFDETCSNPVTCNRPNSTTDARGNTTDYTYDAIHGGVLTATGPAPTANAVRPRTRFTYALTSDEHRVTAISQCRTASSCEGTADEVKTTLEYDANGNVHRTSSGDGAGTLTATSEMSYDSLGNLVAVDGPLPGADDTRRIRYNAARQVTGTISPDPDGAGPGHPLKHRAVRYSYTDGLLTRVETGTVDGPSEKTGRPSRAPRRCRSTMIPTPGP